MTDFQVHTMWETWPIARMFTPDWFQIYMQSNSITHLFVCQFHPHIRIHLHHSSTPRTLYCAKPVRPGPSQMMPCPVAPHRCDKRVPFNINRWKCLALLLRPKIQTSTRIMLSSATIVRASRQRAFRRHTTTITSSSHLKNRTGKSLSTLARHQRVVAR